MKVWLLPRKYVQIWRLEGLTSTAPNLIAQSLIIQWTRLHCTRLHTAAARIFPNPKSLSQSHELINRGKTETKDTSIQHYSVEDLSACVLLTSLFYSVMTFPRAAERRGEGEVEGSRERRCRGPHRESLHQQKGSGFGCPFK